MLIFKIFTIVSAVVLEATWKTSINNTSDLLSHLLHCDGQISLVAVALPVVCTQLKNQHVFYCDDGHKNLLETKTNTIVASPNKNAVSKIDRSHLENGHKI